MYIHGMGKKSKTQIKVVSSKVVYHGPVFQVLSDQVIEPSGVQVRRDIVRHQGSVVIMAVDESNAEPQILLERQYRYAPGEYLWELPAGRVDEGESELAGAKRELIEETGYRARLWKRVMRYYASPGFLDETMAIYLARDLVRGQAQPEADEDIKTRFFPLSAVVQMATSGRLQDGKTIAGVLWLAQTGFGAKKTVSAS
jgi:ADP-ribose pyrophosphatase